VDVLARPTVISLAFLSAGVEQQTNVLPDSARVRGTIRAFEDIEAAPAGGGAALTEALQLFVAQYGQALGVRARIGFEKGPPPTVNDTAAFRRLADPLRTVWPGTLDTTPFRGMFAEDFAFYTSEIPSLYFGTGVARDGLGMADVHTPDFTIHPAALDEGVRLLALLAELGTGGAPGGASSTP
jgi:metal-dependent amidase/aminoacylase/carboxypeptidase family protein